MVIGNSPDGCVVGLSLLPIQVTRARCIAPRSAAPTPPCIAPQGGAQTRLETNKTLREGFILHPRAEICVVGEPIVRLLRPQWFVHGKVPPIRIFRKKI